MKNLNLAPASGGLYPHMNTPVTIASMDQGDLIATYFRSTVPRHKIDVNSENGRVRMAPQYFPPYGKLWMKHATFFVPEIQLIEHAEAIHDKKTLWKGKPVVMPHFTMMQMLDAFSDPFFSTLRPTTSTEPSPYWNPYGSDPVPNPDTYDFMRPVYHNNLAEVELRVLTQEGRRMFKIFKSVGYDFDCSRFMQNASTPLDEYNSMHAALSFNMPALPLLAYLKIYVDYYLSGSFYNSNPLVKILQQIHDGETIPYSGNLLLYDASTGIFNIETFLIVYSSAIRLPHEDNLYTAAWNSPNSPDGQLNLSDVTPSTLLAPYLPLTNSSTDDVRVLPELVLSANHSSNTLYSLTERGEMLRHAVYQFVQRNHLAGTKDGQEFMARFGIKSEDFKNNYVIKIEDGAERIDFNAVMSNAATSQAELGSYAGFGSQGLNVNFNFEATDYGFVITLHWLQIEPIITRGIHPQCLRMDGFDYWIPELDGAAQRAVPCCEISSLRDYNNAQSVKNPTEVFGFVNHGDDYRIHRDNVIGDFLRGPASKFFFGRDYSYIRSNSPSAFMPQSNAIQYWGTGDNKDVTNPFHYYQHDGDRFWFFIEFNEHEESPVKPFDDVTTLNGKGDIQVSKNGKMLA